jgi:hypothetical protein
MRNAAVTRRQPLCIVKISSGLMKILPTLLGAALVALAIPAFAHGALEPREIDTRVLLDKDGAFAPGFCYEDNTCGNPGDLGGFDLLTLDAREAHLADGRPAVAFRVGYQLGRENVAQAIEIHVTANGTTTNLRLEGTTLALNSTTCDRVDGPSPFPGGDGAQMALDCYVAYEVLGVRANDTLSITMTSYAGATVYDVVPGTWRLNGQNVPYVPTQVPGGPGDVSAPTTPGNYTLQGPANLLGLTASASMVDLATGPKTVTLHLRNGLSNFTQAATLNLTLPQNLTANLEAQTLLLDGGANRTVTLTITNATNHGNARVIVTTDFGGYAAVEVHVMPAPAKPDCPHDHNATRHPSCPTLTPTTTEASPAVGIAGGALLVAALASARRRIAQA